MSVVTPLAPPPPPQHCHMVRPSLLTKESPTRKLNKDLIASIAEASFLSFSFIQKVEYP